MTKNTRGLGTLIALSAALACGGCLETVGRGDPGSGDGGATPMADAETRETDGGGPVDGGPPGDGGVPPDFVTEADPITIGTTCTPPPLLVLDSIPNDPSLDDGDEGTLATFEVLGDQLIGKFVRDEEAARGGLRLWQEVVLRIPTNQRYDLVQFDIFEGGTQAAYFNRTGRITTERYGLKIGFNVNTFGEDDADVCAPLVPRRGSFDWSLVHEFGHLRGWLDGSWDAFLDTFEDVRGEGGGYPEDGSPILTGDFVTSYAERADGDEDHAESWTTFVMLDLDAIPAPSAGEPESITKVRWMSMQPGLLELRAAIRITEPDGGGVTVQGAPRLFASRAPVIEPPARVRGVWESAPITLGDQPAFVQRFEIRADDIVVSEIEGGVERDRFSYAQGHRDGTFVRFDQGDDGEVYFYVAEPFGHEMVRDNFIASEGGDELLWSRDDVIADVTLRRAE